MDYAITGYEKRPCGKIFCYIPFINGKLREYIGTTYIGDFTKKGVKERVATAISRI